MQSPDGNQLWCPSKSLWSLIAEHVSTPELPKIRTALGNSLVDMYTDDYSEAEMWYKIWQENQPGNNSSRAGTLLPHQRCPPLADPPVVKELVRAEVKMLLQTLRERAGRDAEELILRYKPTVVDYALGHRGSSYRNATNRENTDNGSRSRSLCSVRSSAEDEIGAIKEKLNIYSIDEVVDRLKSVLMEECEALKSLIKHLKRNIKQKCVKKCDESEPTLAELRDLREALQMQLELYPSSFADSPSPSSALPLRELKSRFRLSAGQRESLQAVSTASVVRPHPPPPLCHPKPRPALSAPPSKTSTSVKRINRCSLSPVHGQHRDTSASTRLRRKQAPMCSRVTSSGHENIHVSCSVTRPASAPIIGETTHHCSPSPEQDSAGFQSSTPASNRSFQIKTPRIPAVHETHPSSILSLSRKCDLSPQMERKSSRNITITSLIPAISLHCYADCYHSNSTHHSVSATGKPQSHDSTCAGGVVSATVQVNDGRREGTSERFYSCVDRRKTNIGINRSKDGHVEKDATRQQSLVVTV